MTIVRGSCTRARADRPQMRDLRAIGTKIVQVLNPTAENAVLRDWDLWGPLIVRTLARSNQADDASSA